MHRFRSTIAPLMVTVIGVLCTAVGCRTYVEPGPDALVEPISEEADRRVEAQARYAAGLAYELSGKPEDALRELVLSVKADPSNEDVALEVSRRLLLAQNLEEAIQIAELAADQKTASGAAHAHLAVLYAEAGRVKDAERANRKAISLAPSVLAGYYNLYALHLEAKQDDKAFAVLEEARARSDDSAEYWLDLAELYANFLRARPERRETITAPLRTCLDQAEKLQLRGGIRRQKLADGYAMIGETKHAVALYLELLEQTPDENQRTRDILRQKLLALYITNQDADGALKQIESLVADYPDNPQANFLLATVAYEKDDFEKATTYFKRTTELKPDYEQAYYSHVGALLNLRKYADAITLLETVRSKWPESFIAQYYSGIAYSNTEQHELALKHFKFAEQLASNNAPGALDFRFYFQMGAELERNALYDEAAKLFRRCLDLKSDFAPAMNYLGYMWADQGINLEEARKLIQKAVDLDPQNPAYLDSLAWVLYKLDQPHLALTYMEEALKHQEEPDATLFDHLGDIQAAIGDLEEARKSWRKSLDVEDNPKVQKKLDGELPAGPKPTQ